jgi:hypothetical protein
MPSTLATFFYHSLDLHGEEHRLVTRRRWAMSITLAIAIAVVVVVVAAALWLSSHPGLPADSYVSLSGVKISADFLSCSINFSNTGTDTATVLEINFTYSDHTVSALPASGTGTIALLRAHSSTSVNCAVGSPEVHYSEQPPAGTPGAGVVGHIKLDGEIAGFTSDFTNSSSH